MGAQVGRGPPIKVWARRGRAPWMVGGGVEGEGGGWVKGICRSGGGGRGGIGAVVRVSVTKAKHVKLQC